MINWNQSSTKRGAVWVVGGFVAVMCTLFGTTEQATSIMAITAGVAGGLGMVQDD